MISFDIVGVVVWVLKNVVGTFVWVHGNKLGAVVGGQKNFVVLLFGKCLRVSSIDSSESTGCSITGL